jgi:hypothetical protein
MDGDDDGSCYRLVRLLAWGNLAGVMMMMMIGGFI